MDIRPYAGVFFQKVNSFNYIATKEYNNDNSVNLLKDIFDDIPDSVQDAQNYQLLVSFEGDVEIGKVITDSSGNKTLDGTLYIPAKSTISFSTQYIKSLFLGDTFLGFRNVSSISPDIKPKFKVTLWIISPDPTI